MSSEEASKEIYSLEIVENGFAFKIKETLYQHFLSLIKNEEILKRLLEIPRTTVGNLCVFRIALPFVDFSGNENKGLAWDNLAKCSKQLGILFMLTNDILTEEEQTPELCLSDDLQLMNITAVYRSDTRFHACPMSVVLSKRGYNLLRENYTKDTIIPLCEEKALDFYFGMSSATKAEFDQSKEDYLRAGGVVFGVRAMIRYQGVPSFTVPGDCACLGANPDEFKYSRLVNSHNLDTPLQQMAMLASVVTLWNEVLKPLHTAGK
ncbi:MAG: hypothetical protein WAV98_01215 [Minisyncoccia bacterium]